MVHPVTQRHAAENGISSMSTIENVPPPRLPRWAPRKKAMEYAADTGSTHFNELMKDGKIRAKKDGVKVIVDLNSIDDYFEGLPDVGPENALTITGT
jgi:hypothetical protein